MSKNAAKKHHFSEEEDYSDDYINNLKDRKRDMNRRKEKRLKNALKTMNIDELIDYEDDGLGEI